MSSACWRISGSFEKLDFMFAKGKLSLEMDGTEPKINLEQYMELKGARHPMLERESCVPLDFQIGRGIRGSYHHWS